MKKISATCPECSHQFPLDEILDRQIDSMVASRSKTVVEARDDEIRKLREQMDAMGATFEERSRTNSELLVAKALKEQERRIAQEYQSKNLALEQDIEQLQTRLESTQQNELNLRKAAHDVELRNRELDLEVERRLAAGTSEIREKVVSQIAEDFRRKDVERETLISDLRKQLVELKQRTEQGSQQAQGEAFETEIRTILKEAFPEDGLEDIPNGFAGGDLIQTVITRSGQRAGKIVWELKQTKSFQAGWIEKLREDRNAIGAEMAVLVSNVLPKGKKGAYLDQGIWIVEPMVAIAIARVARQSLIDVYQASIALGARHEKADILYAYLTNPVFRQRLEAIVECFHQMRDDLEREKRAISKSWKQRERQLDNVVENTIHIYSDIQAVVGQKVLNIQRLEMPAIEG